MFDIEGGGATLSGLTVSGGNATNGGGLYDNRGTLDLTDCTVTGNSGSGEGGGLFNNSVQHAGADRLHRQRQSRRQ